MVQSSLHGRLPGTLDHPHCSAEPAEHCLIPPTFSRWSGSQDRPKIPIGLFPLDFFLHDPKMAVFLAYFHAPCRTWPFLVCSWREQLILRIFPLFSRPPSGTTHLCPQGRVSNAMEFGGVKKDFGVYGLLLSVMIWQWSSATVNGCAQPETSPSAGELPRFEVLPQGGFMDLHMGAWRFLLVTSQPDFTSGGE